MNDYLTIGEIAQIKKISIKSLRYYEKIGILVPVKINPENGYRYYSPEQLLTIDMIKFLATMDIPLKHWHKYLDAEGNFYLKELIEDSQMQAVEEIQRLQTRLNRLELAARGLKDNEKYQKMGGYYQRRIKARNILRIPIEEPQSMLEFHQKLSSLFEEAEKYQAAANYPSGLMLDYQILDTVKVQYYVYLEIYEQLSQHPCYHYLPEHIYRCIRREPHSLLHILDDEQEYIKMHPQGTIISADNITSPTQFIRYPTELQFY